MRLETAGQVQPEPAAAWLPPGAADVPALRGPAVAIGLVASPVDDLAQHVDAELAVVDGQVVGEAVAVALLVDEDPVLRVLREHVGADPVVIRVEEAQPGAEVAVGADTGGLGLLDGVAVRV